MASTLSQSLGEIPLFGGSAGDDLRFRRTLVYDCDCILRNLEFQRKDLRDFVAGILEENHVVGFSTYGEQFHGMHVNQTLTGVAIGAGSEGHGGGA